MYHLILKKLWDHPLEFKVVYQGTSKDLEKAKNMAQDNKTEVVSFAINSSLTIHHYSWILGVTIYIGTEKISAHTFPCICNWRKSYAPGFNQSSQRYQISSFPCRDCLQGPQGERYENYEGNFGWNKETYCFS